MDAYARLRRELDSERVVIIDGGTGTELERRGAEMHEKAWCAMATLTAPDVLRDIHADYIRAGARVVTANTFSSNRNMLEPAGYGCALSFGPNTRNFRQIAERLIGADAAVRVADQQELEQFVVRCLSDIPAADSLGRAARRVVQRHLGATDRTIAALCPNEMPLRNSA